MRVLTSLDSVWKVLGSMLGKSLMATGSHPCSEGTHLLGLCLEGAGQHVGEEFDGYRQPSLQ